MFTIATGLLGYLLTLGTLAPLYDTLLILFVCGSHGCTDCVACLNIHGHCLVHTEGPFSSEAIEADVSPGGEVGSGGR